MADFKLSERAKSDLLAIYDFTEKRFGPAQADGYLAGLERTFGLLADFPLIGLDVSDLRQSYRRYRFKAHYIFYSVETSGILVRTLVHTARDIGPKQIG